MKKLFTSKKWMAGLIVVLCIGITAVCLLVGKEDTDEFSPDPAPSTEKTSDWTDSSTPTDSGNKADSGTATDNQSEEYPKTVSENEDETIIDFTDPSPSKEPAPESPGTEAADESTASTQTSDTDASSGQSGSDSGTPAAGSTNDKGQVYDPAFGWITVQEGISIPADNDGDINKQVGSMGD